MKDISNKTVFVLVILTLVISTFSTLLLMTNLKQNISSSPISQSNINNAQISYGIKTPPRTEDNSIATIGYKILNDNEVIS